ncbi:MAG: DNA recombination protein RmuC [Bacteroidales bacterium]|nr:DNA recombination protein RmuC [Candidatus Liminaster caballi]
MTEILIATVATVVAVIVTAIVTRAIVRSKAEAEIAVLHKEKELLNEKINEKDQEIIREKEQDKIREKEQIMAMRNEIELQTKKLLEQRQAELEQGNRTQLNQILSPFNEKLREMREAFIASTAKSHENSASFNNALEMMMRQSQQLGHDAQQLAEALKNKGKVQGDWGEQILANILENSGLRPGIEYEMQDNVKDGEGNNLRPDVIVNCSDGRRVIIDSKVSLSGFTHYVNATSDEERAAAERENLTSVKNHIRELVEKNYTKLVPGAVPTVLMFIPNEGSYILALQSDHNIASDAFQRHNILIINPTNLMLALQLILLLWQFERKEENDRRIVDAATSMYEKFCTFAETFQRMGDQLQTASRTYDTARGQLCDGRGNLLRQIDALQNLGVTSTKSVTPKLKNNNVQ